jgi:hypothetical protein
VAAAAPGAPAWLSRRGTPDRCHVTVQASNRRLDLALPATVPILELVPTLARLCQVEAEAGEVSRREATPPVWTLARAAGAPFALDSTLAEAGVLDGEVLHLVDVSAWRAPQVSRLGGSRTAPERRGRLAWTASTTSWLLAGLGATALGLPLLALGVAGALDQRAGLLALALALGLAAFLLLGRDRAGRPPVGLALAAAVVALGGAAGAGLAAGPGLRPTGAGLGGGLALLVLGRALPAVAPGGALAAGALALAGAATAAGIAPERTAAVAAAAGCLALQLWPVAGDLEPVLAGSGDRRSGDPRPGWTPVSLSAGLSLVVLVAGSVLLARGGWPGVGLAAVAAAGLGLRAGSRPLLAEALPPAIAGAALLLGLEVLAGLSLAAHGQALAGVALAAGPSLGLIALAGWRDLPGLPTPLTRLGWLGVDLALVVLTLGALGVIDQVARLVHHVVG